MAGRPGRSGGDRSRKKDMTKPDDGPRKPKLTATVSKKWDELLTQLHLPSLRRVDVHELKLLAELLVMSDTLGAAMIQDSLDHKTGRQFLQVTDRIHRLSAAFGLNPADRQRLKQEPDKESDAADEWENE